MAHEVVMPLNDYERSLIDTIAGLPRKILRYHHLTGLSQLVMHELGHEGGFGLEKATYLIDNPDFDHLLGVAGFAKEECHLHENDIWHNPHDFCEHMREARFHNKVRSILNNSFKKRDINLHDAQDLVALGKEMGMKNPAFFEWDMKYDNHGIFLYDQDEKICVWRHGLLKNISALLSMCNPH